MPKSAAADMGSEVSAVTCEDLPGGEPADVFEMRVRYLLSGAWGLSALHLQFELLCWAPRKRRETAKRKPFTAQFLRKSGERPNCRYIEFFAWLPAPLRDLGPKSCRGAAFTSD